MVSWIPIPDEAAGKTAMAWLKHHLPTASLSRIHKALRRGEIRLDSKRVRPKTLLSPGQQMRLPPQLTPHYQAQPSADAGNNLDGAKVIGDELRENVIYRDASALVLNKPAGLAVQGGNGVRYPLDQALSALQFEAKSPPRLIHRLDQPVTGALLLGRSGKATHALNQAFREHQIKKTYRALAWCPAEIARPKPKGIITTPIKGQKGKQSARTEYCIRGAQETTGGTILDYELTPVTGRKHQLRRHLRELGTGIIGDSKYNRDVPKPGELELPQGLYLHSWYLSWPMPHRRGAIAEITAPLPKGWLTV
ncbi:MAG: hypothetical protein BRC33_11580 [Cyanobacteria bacterium SW_9_44_58]|nr:MAG: hypothetical protein BRC33_11580 [Cyanobacteria bacterium SW_9_44_58]